MNVEQEDIDLMAKLFDYAALSTQQERISPLINSSLRHHPEASDTASNTVLQRILSAPNDSPATETGHIRPDQLAVSEELDWPTEDFDIFPAVTNDWTFFGRPWSTHFPE